MRFFGILQCRREAITISALAPNKATYSLVQNAAIQIAACMILSKEPGDICTSFSIKLRAATP